MVLRDELEVAAYSTEHPPHGDPYHVCVRLRAGVEHTIGRIRVRVLAHTCMDEKPRFKLVDPAVFIPPPLAPRTRRRESR
jgi:hypothetical protein